MVTLLKRDKEKRDKIIDSRLNHIAGKTGRFPSAIAECSGSVPSCNVSFAYAFTKI